MEYLILHIQIKKFYFAKSYTDEAGFIQITIPPGAYEIESLNNKIEGFLFRKNILQ